MPFKIRTKLIIAFFGMLVPFLIVFTANYFFAKAIHESIHTSADISYELENLGDLQLALDRLLMPANDYIITADPKERLEFNRLAGEVEKHLALIPTEKRCQGCHQARTAEMVARPYGREASKDLPEEMLILKEIRDKFERIKKYGEAIFSIQKPVGSAEAARLMKEMDALGHKVIDGPIGRHRQMEKKDMQKAGEAAENSWRRFLLSRTLGYLTALIIGVVIALIYSGRFAAAIKALHKSSDSIAKGDFKARVEVKTGDELEQLSNAMNEMAAQLESLYSNLEQKVEERTIELKESEKKYRDLADNALIGVYKSNLKGEILYINDAALRIYEYESREGFISNGALRRYKKPEDRKVFIDTLKEKGRLYNYELELLTKTGKTRNILLSARLEEDEISGMIMDITERKQTDDKIKEQLDYLTRFQKVAVKREFRIKELRGEVEELEGKLKKAQG